MKDLIRQTAHARRLLWGGETLRAVAAHNLTCSECRALLDGQLVHGFRKGLLEPALSEREDVWPGDLEPPPGALHFTLAAEATAAAAGRLPVRALAASARGKLFDPVLELRLGPCIVGVSWAERDSKLKVSAGRAADAPGLPVTLQVYLSLREAPTGSTRQLVLTLELPEARTGTLVKSLHLPGSVGELRARYDGLVLEAAVASHRVTWPS